MKANEYIKKYSIVKAKELVSGIINTISVNGYVCDPCFITDEGEHISYNDLKRLVESHELVEKCGGLNSLKAWVEEKKSNLSLATYFHCNKPPVLIQIENAEKAIADVESCK